MSTRGISILDYVSNIANPSSRDLPKGPLLPQWYWVFVTIVGVGPWGTEFENSQVGPVYSMWYACPLINVPISIFFITLPYYLFMYL